MVNVVIIDKQCTIKIKNIKNNDITSIYKACNFKNDNHFRDVHTFKKYGNEYTVYAKSNGRANNENKYEAKRDFSVSLGTN